MNVYLQSVVIRSNSSSTSNTRSQSRRSRHFSYTDGISSQSEPRVSTTVGQSKDDSSTDKPSSSSANRIQETVCVHETEEAVCTPKVEERNLIAYNDVEVNEHGNGIQLLNQREEKVHTHVEPGICNDPCNSGIPGYLEIADGFSLGINDSVLPLLPNFQHSNETMETDEDFLTESSESCYLHKAEAIV